MEIKKNITTQNFNIGTVNRIKYIVVHYTGNNGDTALANTNYFKSYRGASAHYFVDETSVYQSIDDKNIAWHCGANSYKHPYCRNSNSIGVELCSYKNGNGHFAFKPKTVTNAVNLVKELMAKYNVQITNVIRHYDVTGKICPEPYVRDSNAWNDFKTRLTETKTEEDVEVVETINITVNGKEIKADAIVKNGETFIKLRGLENAGFDVGYDKNTKMRVLENHIRKQPIEVDGKETDVTAVNIGGYNYVSLRDMAAMTGAFCVDYKNGKIVVKTK